MREASTASFEELIAEAAHHPTRGWDFSWLGNRMRTEALPWDYTELVLGFMRRSPDMLDLGTGGGEWLAALEFRAPLTVATEAWPPNVPIAAKRLRPLGIEVVQVDDAPDNSLPEAEATRARLPFPDASFHLVTDRHESFVAREVARILVAGGHFVTQQLGDGIYREFRELFTAPRGDQKPWALSMAVSQVERAGLRVDDSREGHQTLTFFDVGALVWYLRMVPWVVPDFGVEVQRERLGQLHEQIASDGPLVLRIPGFCLVAGKPGHRSM